MTVPNFVPPEVDALNEQMPAFHFVSRLASDDCKAVYMVKQKSLDRRAAIKIYSPTLSGSSKFREEFGEKTKVMAKLAHPNLIGVYDSGYENEMVYLVTEFVAGKPLWNSTKGESIHLKHVQTLVEGICVGMAHAHKNKICHGALSLKNILLDETRMPKIGGFSQASGDASQLDPSALRFRAPEMAEDGAKPTAQSDIYSIGVILREMAVGQTEGLEALAKIKAIGPKLKSLVEKATSADPSKRHRKVEDFYEEMLDAFDPNAPKKPAGALLKTAAVNLPAAGGKPAALKAGGGKSGAPRPAGAAGASARPGSTPKPMAPVKAAPASRLWLHIIIIVVLLIAIRMAWKAYKEKKSRSGGAQQTVENQVVVRPHVIRSSRPSQPRQSNRRSDTADANRGTQAADAFPNEPTASPVRARKVEDSTQVLARMRDSLRSGSRHLLPKGTIEFDNQYFYHVNVPMTWTDAFWYAIDLGGHLAVPGRKASATWMREQVVDNEGRSFWIGAAKSGSHTWTLADGRLWRPLDPAISRGDFVAVGADGDLESGKGQEQREFVIQWSRDGSNPGSLDSLLSITRNSLASNSPIYPPSTRAFGVRHYLYVPQSSDWKQAVIRSRASGGNLIVIGGIAEKFNVQKLVKDADAPDGIWLGGFHLEEKGWRWTTGEIWKSTDWPNDKPTETKDAALLMELGGGWAERSRDAKASGFVIEWSQDSRKGPQ